MRSCFVRFAVPMVFGALTTAQGQLVIPRTVPVLQQEQFAIIPSVRAPMGGVSIAFDDSLADPFINPALASMVKHNMVFGAPFNHNVTFGHGGGRTLPLGGMTSNGDWATAFVFAVQDLDHQANSNKLNMGWYNRYGQVSVARRLPDDLSVGASVYVARLNAMDGFDLLYDGSDAITQVGTLTDFRLGATKHWGDRRLDLLLLNSNTDITHSVQYDYSTYLPGGQGGEAVREIDQNFDRTHIWGAHARFVQPLDDGWRFGWTATANHLSHPKIPDYDIRTVSFVRWDPGATNAFNFGLGIGRTTDRSSYGLDFIQEPMTSRTWGEDATGAHTVDNDFKFANTRLRLGYSRDAYLTPSGSAALGVQFGLDVYHVSYHIDQADHVSGISRSSDENWQEVTPTFGMHLRVKGATVQYNYRLTCTGDCNPLGMGDKVDVAAPSVGFIAAPTTRVNVNGGTSRFHQLTVTLPLAGTRN